MVGGMPKGEGLLHSGSLVTTNQPPLRPIIYLSNITPSTPNE